MLTVKKIVQFRMGDSTPLKVDAKYATHDLPARSVLIYNSIQEAIIAHEGRSLFCIGSALEGEETPRFVFYSKELVDVAEGPWTNDRDGRMFARLRGLFDSFAEGDHITVGMDPYDKDQTCIMARVAPPEEGVWDFRCLDPRPGIRALGCFAEPNTFVALTWQFREITNWDEERNRCKEEWRTLFGALRPFEGTRLNDYITHNASAV